MHILWTNPFWTRICKICSIWIWILFFHTRWILGGSRSSLWTTILKKRLWFCSHECRLFSWGYYWFDCSWLESSYGSVYAKGLVHLLSTWTVEGPSSLLGTTNIPCDRLNGEFIPKLWIIDKGATHHVICDKTWLFNICNIVACPVGLPVGEAILLVIQEDLARLSSHINLHYSPYVPNSNCNLLSIIW